MSSKRRATGAAQRTWREREVRGGYTTDKKIDISKSKLPSRPASSSSTQPAKNKSKSK